MRAGLICALLLLAVPAAAQIPASRAETAAPQAGQPVASVLARKAQRTAAQRKLDSRLLEVEPAPAWVTVDIRADVTPELLARIDELGGTVITSVPRYRAVRARLPGAAVERLAELPEVQFVRTADRAFTHQVEIVETGDWIERSGRSPAARPVASEGDIAHRVDVARERYGIDGTGIGIGVISDGVDTLAERQAEGELPERVTVLPGQAGIGDEGTAMLEIVHDLAPGAELYYATGTEGGEGQFAANIEALCAAGANVIVDDISYFLEPAFQDGIVARGVNAAVEEGCVHFSAASNRGNLNDETSGVWEGDYVAGNAVDADGENLGTAHDFGNGIEANALLENGLAFVLQWSDPLGASANDYDLFLLDAADNVLRSSTNVQDGSQDPIEYIDSGGVNADDTRLLVVKVSGEDRYLRLDTIRGRLEVATDGATAGHNAAERALGVAAVDVRTAGGAGGAFDGSESVETFSADGPRRIFYEPDGTPITPDDLSSTGGRLLQKPDIAAADQVSTGTPGFYRFGGTSAAAPHAAAVAALMLESVGGAANLSLRALRDSMAHSALDIEAPGIDRDSGAGILMAPEAVAAVAVSAARRNRAPAARGELPEQGFLLDDDAVTLSIADAFRDPDGDRLTHRLVSTDPVLLDATLTGTDVTLTPLGPGRLSVLVRATDPEGLSAVQEIRIEIRAGDRDYDTDDDALIEIGTLAQLDAMRYDLDGDGLADGGEWRPYYAAFPEGALEMGCPAGCEGYELTADLDFDTDGSGSADEGDTHWNDGAGWAPIGDFLGNGWIDDDGVGYTATFDGNGHVIANLYIDRPDKNGVGLFGFVGAYGPVGHEIRDVGLSNVDIRGHDFVGGLLGASLNRPVWRAFATGSVSGNDGVGALAGRAHYLFHTYAAARVSATGDGAGGLAGLATSILASYATGPVSGNDAVGGLVGFFDTDVQASYATGRVSGRGRRVSGYYGCGLLGGVGGLAGNACGHVTASYATGPVSGEQSVGGLVGTFYPGNRGFRSFWDVETSGVPVGVGSDDSDDNGVIDGEDIQTTGVVARRSADLQGPTGYEGIFSTWNIDLEGDGNVERDDPWDFGGDAQYPALVADLDRDGSATWEEFGYQVRAGPVLEAHSPEGEARVELEWTGADTGVWSLGPGAVYRVTREGGDGVETIAEDLDGLAYTDTDVTLDAVYAYQVTALVAGGEPVRSARVRVKAGAANGLPVAVGVPEDIAVRITDVATVDFADAFRDSDGDPLTFEAVSSAPDILTVSVSGSRVTLTPAGDGVAIVTVSATDTDGSNEAAVLHIRVAVWPAAAVDYDSDDDGLIEIDSLERLDAMRQDLDGDGIADRGDLFRAPTDAQAYGEAFHDAVERMGCGVLDGCIGYELVADLDFDTNATGTPDAGDAFWNGGTGWIPVGGRDSVRGNFAFFLSNPFTATFDGNGHRIFNLFADVGEAPFAGLFGFVRDGTIRHVGVVDAAATGVFSAGALVGFNFGRVEGSYASGRVVGSIAGGLVGQNRGYIVTSYATAAVSRDPDRHSWVGGLVGYNDSGSIAAAYATGAVTGGFFTGALVGANVREALIEASYATGPVSKVGYVGRQQGGLVGSGSGTLAHSYWERPASGEYEGDDARSMAQLQSPRRYGGLYANWNLDLDADGSADDPWRFGTPTQYPALAVDANGDGRATWQEFGHQLRAAPGLAAEAPEGVAQVDLLGTPVDTGHWAMDLSGTPGDAGLSSRPPAVTYVLYRDDGEAVEKLAQSSGELRYTDLGMPLGKTYRYRLAVVVDGGVATRSEPVAVTIDADATRPPEVVEVPVAQRLEAGDELGLNLTDRFRDPEGEMLLFGAVSSNPKVVLAEAGRESLLLRGLKPGTVTVTVTATDPKGGTVSLTFTVTVPGAHAVWLFPSASDSLGRQGFVRVINRSPEAGEVLIHAIDDAGDRKEPVSLTIDAATTVHFNSEDLETGNAAKGLSGGVGAGRGDWRLEMEAGLDLEVLSYIRSPDGFLTAMHDVAPQSGNAHRIVIFNPAANPNQTSRLRLINPSPEAAQLSIRGIDDRGASPGTEVRTTIPAGTTATLTAEQLESGHDSLTGRLGDGTGKWRLLIEADSPITVMSLLESPGGHVSNLSTTGKRP